MAKVYVTDVEGGTAERYDEVTSQLGPGGVTPPGARFHVAGPTATGWRIIECWDDPAAWQRFINEQVRPIIERQQRPQPPRITELDVDGELVGGTQTPEVAAYVTFPGMDKATFQALEQKVLGGERRLPDGMVQHVNGPSPDGWYFVGLWESEEKRTRFYEETVMPAAAGVEMSGQPRVEILPVHRGVIAPAAARA